MTKNDIWVISKEEIAEQITDKNEEAIKVELKIIDIPYIHVSNTSQRCTDYFDPKAFQDDLSSIFAKLADTDNIQAFESCAVRALIEVRWEFLKKRIFFF